MKELIFKYDKVHAEHRKLQPYFLEFTKIIQEYIHLLKSDYKIDAEVSLLASSAAHDHHYPSVEMKDFAISFGCFQQIFSKLLKEMKKFAKNEKLLSQYHQELERETAAKLQLQDTLYLLKNRCDQLEVQLEGLLQDKKYEESQEQRNMKKVLNTYAKSLVEMDHEVQEGHRRQSRRQAQQPQQPPPSARRSPSPPFVVRHMDSGVAASMPPPSACALSPSVSSPLKSKRVSVSRVSSIRSVPATSMLSAVYSEGGNYSSTYAMETSSSQQKAAQLVRKK
jgi:hypothetical protein